jgi:hypothetical protein
LKNVPTSDTYPPIKVADFKAEVSQTGINISFTAPGDDFDEGTGELHVSILPTLKRSGS